MKYEIAIEQLANKWRADLGRLGNEDSEKVAYDMVQHLVGAENFYNLYDENSIVAEVFDLVARLELPIGVNEFGRKEEIDKAWDRIKELVDELYGKHGLNNK